MAAGVGKTYRMLQEGQAELVAGRDVVIGYLEPHDRPETSEQARGLEVVPRREVEFRGTVLAEMDLAGAARARPRAGADRRARPHQPAGDEELEALRGHRRRARRRDRRLLDRQRPAPRVAERPGRRADRGAGAGDGARLGARRRRRGGADRPHPGGADRAPAGGEDLPDAEHRRGAQQLLQDREPRGAARGQPAPGRPGRRVEAARLQRSRAGRHARAGTRLRRHREGGGGEAPGAGAAAAELAAAGAAGVALGAAARDGPRPALGEAAGAC